MNLDTHWGWEPLPGYNNPDTALVAMSHMGPSDDNNAIVSTWPSQWPDKLTDPLDPGWAGSWNGYFGKDQKNAEQESYFVMDDAQDAEACEPLHVHPYAGKVAVSDHFLNRVACVCTQPNIVTDHSPLPPLPSDSLGRK